ncbi:MAG: leucine-rich repeat protein [Verrucomicrobiota bacterium]
MKTYGLKFCELPLAPLLVLILLLASLRTASGDPVSAEQAKAAVRGWLKADRTPLQTTVGQKVKRVETFNDAKGTVLYHVVYLDPEGFVIVAADDLIEPIVGFASGGTFDPSTDNPLGALVSNDLPGRVAKVKGIAAAKVQGLQLVAKNKWERLNSIDQAGPGVEPLGITNVSDVRVAPLVQSKWSQLTVGGLACYNYFTPPYAAGSTNNYYSGCVATAMAQLMRYYQWPASGVGATPFRISIEGVATMRSLRGGDGNGSAYSWIDMALDPSSGVNDAQRQAIGALCADAGVAVDTDYGNYAYGGSSADGGFTAKTALVSTFGYNNAIMGNGADLNGMVNPDLDSGCPVIFAISGAPGGHEIICDGYGYNVSTLYHHLNLGWANNDTAWYNLPTIDTSQGKFTSIDATIYNVWTNGTGEIISGHITDSNGAPIAEVVVTALRSGGGTYTATSNTNGIYALTSVPSSSQYAVNAGKAGYAFTEQIVTTGRSADHSSTAGNQWAVDFTPVPLNYSYTTNNGAVTIVLYTGLGGAVTIPSTISGLPVTSIGYEAFYACSSLTSVAIPNSVTNIGDGAFSGCIGLTNVAIPNSVTSIAGGVFYSCASLTGVTIPNSVTSIAAYAFSGCSALTSVIIPNSVTSIGYEAFMYCSSLTNVTIPNSVTNIGNEAFYFCVKLTSVTIPNSVTSIGNDAFHGCQNLTSVTIPSGVTSIGNDAFRYCLRLTSITVDALNSAYSSVDGVLFNKSQTMLIQWPGGKGASYTIPNSATSIGDYAFYCCVKLTSVTIPNTVLSIGNNTFSGCPSLTSVYFQGNAPGVGSEVFAGDSLATIYYLSGTTGWTNPWGGCPAVVVTVPDYTYTATNGTITITRYTGSARVVNITDMIGGLPVTSIGNDAFHFCTNLTDVTIPNSITNIGGGPFGACTSLNSITVDPGNPVYSSVAGVLFNKSQTTLIQCPGGQAGSFMIPNSVTTIGDEAFNGCNSLTSVTIHNSVTNIGDWAFSYCSSLTNIPIPTSVTSIGAGAFGWCISLTSVTIPNSVTGVGDSAFSHCSSLTNILIPNSVTSIGDYAFWWCTSLASVTIPNSVTNIGGQAFAYCTSLTNVPIPNSVTSIGAGAFVDDYSLTNVTIPASVTTIGDQAFVYCTSLTSITVNASDPAYSSVDGVLFDKSQTLLIQYPGGKGRNYTIPNGVTTIGGEAFVDDDSLTSVTLPGSVTSIGFEALSGCANLVNVYFEGNVPTNCATDVFDGDNKATIYFLPGTTGWVEGGSLDGLPTHCLFLAGMVSPTAMSILGWGVDVWPLPPGFYMNIPPLINGVSVASIGDSAFAGSTNLIGVTLPDSVTNIGNSAFSGCTSLSSVTLPDSITRIRSNTFAYCTSLSSVTLPNSVTNIGNSAFDSCANLTSAVIGINVTHIGDGAFGSCTSLTAIYFQGNAPSLSSSVFSNDYDATVYYLPGTTGWGSWLGGRPAVLWNPQVANDATFGVLTNCFGFNITGTTNIPIVLEACTNLAGPTWIPLQSCSLTNGSLHFSDPDWTNYPSRFYRIRAP